MQIGALGDYGANVELIDKILNIFSIKITIHPLNA